MAIMAPMLNGNSRNCVWVGNGTQAIMLLLQEIGLSCKRIAVSVNVCPSVVQAILYSGNQPHYLDIDEDNMGMSPSALERDIGMVSAVISVHAYGTVCSIKSIAEICRKHQKFLIEDCAQALGAHVEGQPVGTFGDAAIFSFGAGKIIDLKYGGAVISENTSLIQRVKTHVANMPKWTNEFDRIISDLSALHTSFYNRFYPNEVQKHSNFLLNAVFKAKHAYLFHPPDDFLYKVQDSLKSLDANLSLRRRRAIRFRELFEKEGLNFHWPSNGGVFWRFNLLLKSRRDELLRTLLAEDFKVSSWYPPIDLFMNTEVTENKFPVADRIGAEIMNLWVNTEVDDTYVEQISHRIIEYTKATKM